VYALGRPNAEELAEHTRIQTELEAANGLGVRRWWLRRRLNRELIHLMRATGDRLRDERDRQT
jgi:hypothetical protein